VDIDASGQVLVFDSLTQRQGFDGFHWLAADFPILYAFGILDLPNDWQSRQDTHEKNTFPLARSRYGELQNVRAETVAATALKEARRRNPTHATFLDDLWSVYVMAVAYGRYSVQDILNHITSLRRGKGPIFDFNLKRSR
jgi:hypothetical protein